MAAPIHNRSAISGSNFAVVAFAVAALGVSLSERMPFIWSGFLSLVIRVGRLGEATLAIDLIDHTDSPWQADELGHVILWATGMVVIGLFKRRVFSPDMIAVSLLGASLGIEALQSLTTQTRAASISDIVANATGIMFGLCVVVLVSSLSSLKNWISTREG